MSIRNCRVIAIEGAHGTGKSTLAYALTAYYKAHHVHAATLAELARESPFVEEAVIHGKENFDITAELHLFASQVAREMLLARYHEVLICDKTVANVLGYSRIFLRRNKIAFPSQMLKAVESFCRIYAKQYDAIVYASDFYELNATKDPFRPQDLAFQKQADESIRQVCKDINLTILELPLGLSLEEKVAWVTQRLVE